MMKDETTPLCDAATLCNAAALEGALLLDKLEAETTEWANANALDLAHSRKLEQEALDLLGPSPL